jgi:hypothetical protein
MSRQGWNTDKTQRGLRPQPKGRQKSKGKKLVIRESGLQIPEDSFFCPRFFCLSIVDPGKGFMPTDGVAIPPIKKPSQDPPAWQLQ